MALELSYGAALQNDADARGVVKALNRLDGVQGVSLERMDSQVESSDPISAVAREWLPTNPSGPAGVGGRRHTERSLASCGR